MAGVGVGLEVVSGDGDVVELWRSRRSSAESV